jgi:YfiH family protein
MGPLPQPNEHFSWVQAAAGPALICTPLASVAPHVYTTRPWRLGAGAVHTGDVRAWHDVAIAMQVADAELVRVRQVHGAAAVSAAVARGLLPEADIIISDDRTLALAVQAADCTPILLADVNTGVVAAAHAGWRGMARGAPAAAVKALSEQFGTDPAHLVAGIGPSVGACCYEVGPDVKDAFTANGFSADATARWFTREAGSTKRNPPMHGMSRYAREGHWFFDGWACVREQLASAGVPKQQIFAAALCTASHADVFCSYRRDGPPAGRMAAAIRRLR